MSSIFETAEQHVSWWFAQYAKEWTVTFTKSFSSDEIIGIVHREVRVPMVLCMMNNGRDIPPLFKAAFPDFTNRTLKKVYSIRPPRYTSIVGLRR